MMHACPTSSNAHDPPYTDKTIATSPQGDFLQNAQNQIPASPLDSLGFSTPNPYIVLPCLHSEKHHKQRKKMGQNQTMAILRTRLFLSLPNLASPYLDISKNENIPFYRQNKYKQ